MVTGNPAMISNSSTKSARCIGSTLASAFFRPSASSARIISCMATMRSGWKNMCSVRHRPMPSAPNLTAARASSGVSALVRTFSRRRASAHSISVAKSSDSCGSTVGTRPSITVPAAPSMVIRSPSATRTPLAVKDRSA